MPQYVMRIFIDASWIGPSYPAEQFINVTRNMQGNFQIYDIIVVYGAFPDRPAGQERYVLLVHHVFEFHSPLVINRSITILHTNLPCFLKIRQGVRQKQKAL